MDTLLSHVSSKSLTAFAAAGLILGTVFSNPVAAQEQTHFAPGQYLQISDALGVSLSGSAHVDGTRNLKHKLPGQYQRSVSGSSELIFSGDANSEGNPVRWKKNDR